MSRPWMMAALAALALGACATPPPRATAPVAARPTTSPAAQKPTSSTATSAKPVAAPATTAVPGVIVLAPSNYERDKAQVKQKLAKVAADSLPRAEVGYTLDVLQGRLRQVAGPNARVERQDERIVIDFSGHIDFVADGTALDSVGQQVLAPIARVLSDYRTTLVAVLVRGPAVAGKQDQRANVLARLLVQAGVAAPRIVVLGWGSSAAAAAAGTGGAARIELQIEPIVRANALPASKAK